MLQALCAITKPYYKTIFHIINEYIKLNLPDVFKAIVMAPVEEEHLKPYQTAANSFNQKIPS